MMQISNDDAESVRKALDLIGDVRRRVTLADLEKFVRENARSLGGSGFIESIGHTLVAAAQIPSK